jgi:autotransporter-associated beta strand protein
LVVLASGGTARAQTYNWDPAANGSSSGGNGTWDTTTIWFNATANGTVNGGVSVPIGALLTGTGSFGANLTVSGGTLTPGTSTTIGTMPAIGGNLAVNSGLFKTKVSGATADQITSITGSASFASNSVLSIAQRGAPTNSSYTILTAAGGITGLTAGTLTTIGRTTYTLDAAAPASNSLKLNISGGGPATLVWNNAGGTAPADGITWDVQTTPPTSAINQNWRSSTSLGGSGGAGTNDFYYDGDNVKFTDANNGNFTVNLASAVAPGSISVSNTSGTYVFGGTGSITGLTGLTKSGAGTLTINTANAYTGTTSIQGGTVNAGNAAALGTGTLVVAGATLDNSTAGALTLITLNLSGLSNFVYNSPTNAFRVGMKATNNGATLAVDFGGQTTPSGTPTISKLSVSGGVLNLNTSAGPIQITFLNDGAGVLTVGTPFTITLATAPTLGNPNVSTPFQLNGTPITTNGTDPTAIGAGTTPSARPRSRSPTCR